LNVINNRGETILYKAAKRGKLINIKTLIEHGADINLKNKDINGYTILENYLMGMYNTVNQRLDFITFAINYGAKLSEYRFNKIVARIYDKEVKEKLLENKKYIIT